MTDNEIVSQMRNLARGQSGYSFRSDLRDRYLKAFRAANGSDRVPSVMYLNGWWEFRYDSLGHAARYRTERFIRMMLHLEDRARQGIEVRK